MKWFDWIMECWIGLIQPLADWLMIFIEDVGLAWWFANVFVIGFTVLIGTLVSVWFFVVLKHSKRDNTK